MKRFVEPVMIVPKLPPAIDGIGDYGFHLARQLYQDTGWKTRFIVGTPDWQSEDSFFETMTVAERSENALIELLPDPSTTVLLHYAGHGYANRGCPFWLVSALKQWCQAGGRLVTMFHELYATSPLLSSAIVTSPIQKHLTTQLIQMSDRVLTSRQSYAAKIQKLSCKKHADVSAIPIFSNVGELIDPLPLEQRNPLLVIFGSRSTRARIYQRSQFLAQLCDQLEIEEMIDIGAKLDTPIPASQLGILPASEVSHYLNCSIAGVVDYPIAYLAKSGIFAAYCSHGILPVVLSSPSADQDGLKANEQYWLANSSVNLVQAQKIASAAHRWYQSHTLKIQAQQFAQCLSSDLSESLCR